ncbi:uncharacterized protein PGTG_22129 [Puccinia graminis f. sp. tritici CRL 75-36-700-3]|uniref:Uncharacterized protein n=1 Tax=Puccinia graminis f. sp. tritici (strain CRL 75-36-700-3 / race SCCL) TaxID=418459 RepID=H6QTJ0_PUCGT|nr:uncharacterized protein PGTG_22129 [Puccinia graminis f. sp. tritici CRL 75-36-700-3]EHS64205.1 hypothetical protein PGTG_22129 [Puccinia graminis f. sp. tritici CRL 75-36-700-3]
MAGLVQQVATPVHRTAAQPAPQTAVPAARTAVLDARTAVPAAQTTAQTAPAARPAIPAAPAARSGKSADGAGSPDFRKTVLNILTSCYVSCSLASSQLSSLFSASSGRARLTVTS